VPTLKLEVEELGGPMRPSQHSAPPQTPRSSTPMGGLEMLMKGANAGAGEINDQSIDDLASSLNQYVEDVPRTGLPGPPPTLRIDPMPEHQRTVRVDTGEQVQARPQQQQPPPRPAAPPSAIGQQAAAAVQIENKDRSWDGFRPFSGGGGPAAAGPAPAPAPRLTEAEIIAEKFKYLRYLESLEKKGIPVSRKYDMKSPLDEMKAEYELIKGECEKKQSVAFQGKMLMAAVTGLEYLNSKFDPFDIQLNGWGESVEENKEEYSDVFAELHEKYKTKASIAPEIKLMFLLAGSATMVHMTNTMFQPQLPGMDDLVQHNPELANRIAGAAADGLVSRGQPSQGQGRSGQQLAPPVHTAQPHHMPPGTVQAPARAEMKGPDNFEEIMARVKRKNDNVASGVQLRAPAPGSQQQQQPPSHAGVRFAPQENAPEQPRTVSLKPSVLEGLQKAERTPIRQHPNNQRKRRAVGDNVLKLEI
jgi:hypothetical protein